MWTLRHVDWYSTHGNGEEKVMEDTKICQLISVQGYYYFSSVKISSWWIAGRKTLQLAIKFSLWIYPNSSENFLCDSGHLVSELIVEYLLHLLPWLWFFVATNSFHFEKSTLFISIRVSKSWCNRVDRCFWSLACSLLQYFSVIEDNRIQNRFSLFCCCCCFALL